MSAYEKFAQVYDLFMDNIDMKDGRSMLQIVSENMRLQMVWFWNLDVEPGQ